MQQLAKISQARMPVLSTARSLQAIEFSRATILQCEGSIYIGLVISAAIFGIYLGIYFLSIHALLVKPNLTRSRRTLLLSYGTLLLMLNTTFFMSTPLLGQRMWIQDRNMFRAGPLMYYDVEDNTAGYMILGNISQNFAMFMSDALLIYRCYVVFGHKSLVIMFPTLCLIGVFALSMAAIPSDYNLMLPLGDKLNAIAIALSVATNAMTTAMISKRILTISADVRQYVMTYPQRYTCLVTILVESAAPCAILGILISVPIFISTDTNWIDGAFLPWSSLMALCPQLIIFRIAQGTAWSASTQKELTSITLISTNTPDSAIFLPIWQRNRTWRTKRIETQIDEEGLPGKGKTDTMSVYSNSSLVLQRD